LERPPVSKDSDRAQELFADMLGAVCRDTGLREDLALPFVASAFSYLQSTYGGQRLYFPAQERRYDVLHIAKQLADGVSERKIARDNRMSRGALRRLIGEGLVPSQTKIRPAAKK
jgi:hypothetical protein